MAKDKRSNQRRHSQVRAEQRFGIGMDTKTYEELCSRIRNAIGAGDKGVVYLEKQSNRVSIMAIHHGEEWVPVCYDKQRKSIATFLPREALNPYLKKLEGIKYE